MSQSQKLKTILLLTTLVILTSKSPFSSCPSNAVKNDTRSPQEILAYSMLSEPFDPANYSNNTPTKSSLSSKASYLSIQERRKT